MADAKKEKLRSKFQKKELLKPSREPDDLVKEVEFLCGELANCPQLRKMKNSHGVDVDDDILF